MKHYFTRFEEAIKANWERPALGNFRGEVFTFGELATQIAKFHVFFEAIGLKKGDKVALCAKNSARWGIAFFSANTYEAVVVPILADFHPESIYRPRVRRAAYATQRQSRPPQPFRHPSAHSRLLKFLHQQFRQAHAGQHPHNVRKATPNVHIRTVL